LVGHNGYMAVCSYSGMPWDEAERNMKLFAEEVAPELRKVQVEKPQFAMSA
jgi:hypothetical protein